MNALTNITELMAQIGPLVHAEEVRQFSENEWGVAFNEETIVEVAYDEDLQKLVFECPVGKVDPREELEVYRLMLYLNLDWRDTGGLRMALSPVDEVVHQIFDLAVSGLTLESLTQHLSDFAKSAKHSRNLIENGVTSALETGEASFAGMMRV